MFRPHPAGAAVLLCVQACAADPASLQSEADQNASEMVDASESTEEETVSEPQTPPVDPGSLQIDDDDLEGEPEVERDCSPKPIGLLRDFQSPYAPEDATFGDFSVLDTCPVYGDFQFPWAERRYPIDYLGYPETGIAAAQLGPDRKPVYSGRDLWLPGAVATPDNRDPNPDRIITVTSAETFESWYRDDPDCNHTVEYELPMIETADGKLIFDSSSFFPLDDSGFGNSSATGHNFHFTFELHMKFTYRAGDVFSFTGDDDLFVYINDELVIDLGGAHAEQSATVSLDELGLVEGQEYPIDFFHAERAEGESNFHIETSLQFTNCDPILVR